MFGVLLKPTRWEAFGGGGMMLRSIGLVPRGLPQCLVHVLRQGSGILQRLKQTPFQLPRPKRTPLPPQFPFLFLALRPQPPQRVVIEATVTASAPPPSQISPSPLSAGYTTDNTPY